jgi:gas vesicle protein
MMARNHIAETILTFVVGAGIGAVAALLLAPKSGEELRDDITEGVNDGVNQIRATGKELNRRAQKVTDMAREQVQDAVDAADGAYNHAKKA